MLIFRAEIHLLRARANTDPLQYKIEDIIPEINEHTNAHEQFTALFKEIKKEFLDRGGDSYLAIRLEKEIRNWWEDHILKMDMKYVPYIQTVDEK